jgi:hypothetical protein
MEMHTMTATKAVLDALAMISSPEFQVIQGWLLLTAVIMGIIYFFISLPCCYD